MKPIKRFNLEKIKSIRNTSLFQMNFTSDINIDIPDYPDEIENFMSMKYYDIYPYAMIDAAVTSWSVVDFHDKYKIRYLNNRTDINNLRDVILSSVNTVCSDNFYFNSQFEIDNMLNDMSKDFIRKYCLCRLQYYLKCIPLIYTDSLDAQDEMRKQYLKSNKKEN